MAQDIDWQVWYLSLPCLFCKLCESENEKYCWTPAAGSSQRWVPCLNWTLPNKGSIQGREASVPWHGADRQKSVGVTTPRQMPLEAKSSWPRGPGSWTLLIERIGGIDSQDLKGYLNVTSRKVNSHSAGSKNLAMYFILKPQPFVYRGSTKFLPWKTGVSENSFSNLIL